MPTQIVIAEHLDLSTKSVQELASKLKLDFKSLSMDQIRVAYIRNLRERASGRITEGDLDPIQEKAGLAKAQRERIEMQNQVTRRDLVPASALEFALAGAAAKVIGVLDGIPGRVKRMSGKLSAEDVLVITKEIAKARNEIAELSIDDILDETPDEVVEDIIDD